MSMTLDQMAHLWGLQQQAYGRDVTRVPNAFNLAAHEVPQEVINVGFAEDSNRMGMPMRGPTLSSGMVHELADHGAYEIRLSPRSSFYSGGE